MKKYNIHIWKADTYTGHWHMERQLEGSRLEFSTSFFHSPAMGILSDFLLQLNLADRVSWPECIRELLLWWNSSPGGGVFRTVGHAHLSPSIPHSVIPFI